MRLCLRKPRSNKKVQWTQGTVDNEHMNKKKSKCCCIYEKPRSFGESSSEDSDDECEHCHGHKDAHKKISKLNAETAKEEITPSVHQKKNCSEDSDDKCDSCQEYKGAHKKIVKVNSDIPTEEIVSLASESIPNSST